MAATPPFQHCMLGMDNNHPLAGDDNQGVIFVGLNALLFGAYSFQKTELYGPWQFIVDNYESQQEAFDSWMQVYLLDNLSSQPNPKQP